MINLKIMRGPKIVILVKTPLRKTKNIIKCVGGEEMIPSLQIKPHAIYGILVIYVVSSKAIGNSTIS